MPDFSDKSFKEDVSAECVDFIKKLLDKDPERRLTVDQALKHPFFHNENMVQKKSQESAQAKTEGQSK